MSTSPGRDSDATVLAAGERRRGRERALGLLYEAEVKVTPLGQVLDRLPSPPEQFAYDLIVGIDRHFEEIDELISSHATAWAIERLPVIDRQLLRVATYELLFSKVPAAVVIDEAVELAKEYSTEDSGRYVNGVLAAIDRERAEDPPAKS